MKLNDYQHFKDEPIGNKFQLITAIIAIILFFIILPSEKFDFWQGFLPVYGLVILITYIIKQVKGKKLNQAS